MSFPGLAVQRTWHLVDAANQTVGRLATTIAPILRGKHKPTFRPNGDCGDYVVIINADKVGARRWHVLGVARVGSFVPSFLPSFLHLKIIHNLSFPPRQVQLTGKKWSDKIYRWHTGYPGGLKQRPAREMLERKPTEILRKAILGMLYRNNLRQSYMEPRLKIYAGEEHPHTAQLPRGVAEGVMKVPRKRVGGYHFGLKKYSETPFQVGGAKGGKV
ncbi:hypothetical protein HJC23_001378 [Cyclotella cryptica]|uniref:50S ribosomal protein L13 n=1 Tax=Cyclotella cryptica TaxID=29204 RepID=A0ABD3P7B6_9STRA|eukprot:CCRYP_016704-RA/>CCRYP_016704-RA protein AED:0.05 eAED:0.02 QI:0/-1/0/1/-1/1/1/0/215